MRTSLGLCAIALALLCGASSAAAETVTVSASVSGDGASVSYSEDVPNNAGFGSARVDGTGLHCGGGGQVQGAVYRYTCA